jgi:hypothetical protein
VEAKEPVLNLETGERDLQLGKLHHRRSAIAGDRDHGLSGYGQSGVGKHNLARHHRYFLISPREHTGEDAAVLGLAGAHLLGGLAGHHQRGKRVLDGEGHVVEARGKYRKRRGGREIVLSQELQIFFLLLVDPLVELYALHLLAIYLSHKTSGERRSRDRDKKCECEEMTRSDVVNMSRRAEWAGKGLLS